MVRVHELATELEVPSSKVLEVSRALGVEVKSHMSSLSNADANKIKDALTSKTKRSGSLSGKRDFRVRDISTPTKSPSVRPRPTLQTKGPERRVVTRKVIKRVVRRAPDKDDQKGTVIEEHTVPSETVKDAPVVSEPEKKAPEKKVEETGQDKAAKTTGTEIKAPDQKDKQGGGPQDKRKDRKSSSRGTDSKDRPSRRDRQKRRGDGGQSSRRDGRDGGRKRGEDSKYTPVGKDRSQSDRKRPPKPKVPKIPSPDDYLRPKEQDLAKDLQKLAKGGLKTKIDTSRKKPAPGAPNKPGGDKGNKRKRRRKIIKDDKRSKGPAPLGGRGKSKRQQLQSQLDQSPTIRKRGRRGGRRDRLSDRKKQAPAPPKKIRIGEHITIKELSAQTGLKSSQLIGFLMKELEVFATINQTVDQEIAALICDHFNFEYQMEKIVELEDVLRQVEDKPEDLKSRPPVVTVLGHVDHGKTKLLDAIRGTDVVATEAGGITQKIGAFQVDTKTRDGEIRTISFIDTPGHAAFTAMRARGAEVTDVAVLVVAANDGVMPQTLEAIDHAKSAGVEIVVAINKIDLKEANPELVKQQLSEHGLVPEEWGGQTIMVPISAKQKLNIDELLEQILTVTEILELKANPTGMAEGAIIEARLDRGRGALATVIVKRGTLDIGDYVVVGRSWGRIRQMTDEDGNTIEAAGPSTPVLLSGLNNVPAAGDKLNEVKDEKTAREIFEKREMDHRQGRLKMVNTISLEDFYEQLSKGETKELNIILKADLQGSIEALRSTLEQLSTDEVAVKFISTAVGNITDSDIMLAMASKAIIIGFNVVASPEIRKQAGMEGVEIMTYNIIYKAVEDIQAALEGMLEPEYKENITGRAEVRAIFKRTGKLVVAGLFVNEGKLQRGVDIRILRDGEKIYSTSLGSLKRFKEDVKEVEHGYECGIMLDGFNDLREGDKLEAYETVKVLRTLDSPSRKQG